MKNTIVAYIRNLAFCFWLGEMLFFIVIFAPRVFKILPRLEAAKLQASIFPAYFMAGIVCGVIILTSILLSRFWQEYKKHTDFLIAFLLCSFALAIFTYSYFVLTPEITRLQQLVLFTTETVLPENKQAFDALHKLSVRVNAAALFSLLGLLRFIF